ncbi:hypothetical protein EVAR_65086_1 [Eumeta japonica]|uniref:Uncharacterized protein n=1 Tax=Eumeta variegata TaxID=151549 RepID=A0A4C1Z4S0_EUMVA|nr:hypothetical protein EVAR_65086_1 [Eumeta japonica]
MVKCIDIKLGAIKRVDSCFCSSAANFSAGSIVLAAFKNAPTDAEKLNVSERWDTAKKLRECSDDLRPFGTSGDELNEILKQHFNIESIGVASRELSHDPKKRAFALLDSESVRLPRGQFETCLLWKSDNEVMPESYDTAMRRLRGIT